VLVYSTSTGKIVMSHSFYGSIPGECPDVYSFYIGTSGSSLNGGPPEEFEVTTWLKNDLK
jgi:hypothetical protein